MEKTVQCTDIGMAIIPYRPKQCKDLERKNSDFDHVYHKSKEISGFYVLWEKKGDYDLYCYLTYYQNPAYYENSLKGYSIIRMKEIEPVKAQRFYLSPNEELTDIQIEMVNQIQSGRKMTEVLNKRWYINLGTGFGKTLLSLYLAAEIGYKILVVAPSSSILKQWKTTLIDKFTIVPERIITIDSSEFLKSITEYHHDTTEEDIFLITSSMISTFGNKYGWYNVQKALRIMGIGCLIIDEAHSRMGNTIRLTASTNIRFIQYLSADYGQGQYAKEQKFLSVFASVPVIRPKQETMEEMKYTVGIIVKFNSMPTKQEAQLAIYDRYGFDAEKYMQYQMKKKVFKEALIWTIKRINKVNLDHYQTLILFTNIWAVDEIAEYLQDNPYMSGKSIVRYHGKVPREEKELFREADFIVATYSSFSTGIDVNTIKYVIGTNQSNKVEDNQTAGRAGRKFDTSKAGEVFYFMMIDEGFSYCKKKLPIRVDYLYKMKMKKIVQCRFYNMSELDVADPGDLI